MARHRLLRLCPSAGRAGLLPAAFAAVVLLGASALAAEVAGIKVPDTITVAGKELKLNGAGVRRATIFKAKVYVGALYLGAPSSDPAAIVQADEPKVVHMRFLRDVARDKVMDTYRDGFKNNSGDEEAAALGPSLDRLAAVMPPEIKEGQEMRVTYQPGTGTTVSVPGGGEVTIEGKRFADAMFRNWLGKDPADSDLKEKMLGR